MPGSRGEERIHEGRTDEARRRHAGAPGGLKGGKGSAGGREEATKEAAEGAENVLMDGLAWLRAALWPGPGAEGREGCGLDRREGSIAGRPGFRAVAGDGRLRPSGDRAPGLCGGREPAGRAQRPQRRDRQQDPGRRGRRAGAHARFPRDRGRGRFETLLVGPGGDGRVFRVGAWKTWLRSSPLRAGTGCSNRGDISTPGGRYYGNRGCRPPPRRSRRVTRPAVLEGEVKGPGRAARGPVYAWWCCWTPIVVKVRGGTATVVQKQKQGPPRRARVRRHRRDGEKKAPRPGQSGSTATPRMGPPLRALGGPFWGSLDGRPAGKQGQSATSS